MRMRRATLAAVLCAAAAVRARAAPRATYHGGPLLPHVQIVTIYWSPGVRYQDRLNEFYRSMADGPYLGAIDEYVDPSASAGARRWLGPVTDAAPAVSAIPEARPGRSPSGLDPAPPPSTTISEADVERELGRLLDVDWIPAPEDDTVYMVHFPPDARLVDGGGARACETWCGAHSAFTRGAQRVYFAMLPDLGPRCGAACALADGDFDSETVVASEELAEAATDPAGYLEVRRPGGVTRVSILSWLDDASGSEIGDACAPRWSRTAGFAVRSLWSNRRGACVSGPEAAAAPGRP